MFLRLFVGLTGKLDVVFAVDGSSEVTPQALDAMKAFVKAQTQSYEISPSETHIGLVQYSNDGETSLRLDAGTSASLVEEGIELFKIIGGQKQLDKAISHVNNNVFSKSGGSRSNANQLLVLLTSGKIDKDRKAELERAATQLKSRGIQVVVVAIGKDIDEDDLLPVASSWDRLIVIKLPSDLPSILGDTENAIGKTNGKTCDNLLPMISSWFCVGLALRMEL